jgi:hypothetical protein
MLAPATPRWYIGVSRTSSGLPGSSVSRSFLITQSCSCGIWRRISGKKFSRATWRDDSLSISMPIFWKRSFGLAVPAM